MDEIVDSAAKVTSTLLTGGVLRESAEVVDAMKATQAPMILSEHTMLSIVEMQLMFMEVEVQSLYDRRFYESFHFFF